MKDDQNGNVLLSIRNVSKRFPGVQALSDVSIDIRKHEVLGLAGENGAGKSTLFKVIVGVYRQDSGEMFLEGKPLAPVNYRNATERGISMVFQEQNLIPNIAGYENIFFSHEGFFINRFGFLDKKKMIEQTRTYFAQFGLDVDPARPVGTYSFHQRQMLEIARAFIVSRLYGVESPLILLDEPTAALSEVERELLFSKIAEYSDRATFVLISHRLSEMMSHCGRIIVLKDGRNAGVVERGHATQQDLHTLMVGRAIASDIYRVFEQKDDERAEPIVEVRGFTRDNIFRDISFSLRKGEVLGIGGLVGCGKEELGRALFGIERFESGMICKHDRKIERVTIPRMIRNRFGYVPSERKGYGIIEYFPVGSNISLPSIFSLVRGCLPLIDRGKERNLILKLMEKFRIKARREQLCFSLSGGNQQKVVLAKWIAKNLDVLILNNPTRGIDVGAKEEIYTHVREIVKEGLSVILITDDLLELVGLSNRIIIMKEGKITNQRNAYQQDKPTEKELIQYMV